MRTTDIPQQLESRPFNRHQAERYGLTRHMLRGLRFRQLFRGVYVCAGVQMTLPLWLRAAILVLPGDAVVSHVSALWVYGVEVGHAWPLHFSTNTCLRSYRPGICLHRRRGRLTSRLFDRLPVLGPDRSFVDSATVLNAVQLITAGDWLLHLGRTDRVTLRDYVMGSHFDGVVRARLALAWVREKVESPMESLVRLLLVFARLPEPGTNLEIMDSAGRFIARVDMAYVTYKVLVEYDGQWHDRSQKQRQRDRERRELLEALGWRVIVVTSEDLKDKREIAWRVYRALRERGYDGRTPHFNAMWTKWFG